MKKIILGWEERTGANYWGTDRMERMLKTKDLEGEDGALALLEHVDLKDVKRVVDVGSGIGRRHKYFPNSDYVGIDREKVMVENGKKVFPHLDLRLADAQELDKSLPDLESSFDLALTFHVLQYNHVDQQEAILAGVKFLLKPGALFYMKENTIYEHNNIGYSDLSATHSINKCSYTAAGWKSKLKRHGFTCLHEAGHGHFLFRRE